MIGLNKDTVTISRPATTADAEGNPTQTLTTVFSGAGTYGSASTRDELVAAQKGQVVDAVVAMTFEPRPGDRLVVRGDNYEVVAVKDVRLHNRVFIRRVDG